MPNGFSRAAFALLGALALASCRHAPTSAPAPTRSTSTNGLLAPHAVIPLPATADVAGRDSFAVTPRTTVYVAADASAEVEAIGRYTAELLSTTAGATARRLAAGTSVPDS